ncbi:hypothetical protein Tco_0156689 [Tanacetum coccineum]
MGAFDFIQARIQWDGACGFTHYSAVYAGHRTRCRESNYGDVEDAGVEGGLTLCMIRDRVFGIDWGVHGASQVRLVDCRSIEFMTQTRCKEKGRVQILRIVDELVRVAVRLKGMIELGTWWEGSDTGVTIVTNNGRATMMGTESVDGHVTVRSLQGDVNLWILGDIYLLLFDGGEVLGGLIYSGTTSELCGYTTEKYRVTNSRGHMELRGLLTKEMIDSHCGIVGDEYVIQVVGWSVNIACRDASEVGYAYGLALILVGWDGRCEQMRYGCDWVTGISVITGEMGVLELDGVTSVPEIVGMMMEKWKEVQLGISNGVQCDSLGHCDLVAVMMGLDLGEGASVKVSSRFLVRKEKVDFLFSKEGIRTLFCFTMIGRADIEGSKSNVAMNAFVEVKNRKKKGKVGSNQHHQFSGIKLSKPNSNFQYRPVSKPGKDMDDASDLGANGPKEGSSSQPTIAKASIMDNFVSIKNSFDALMDSNNSCEANEANKQTPSKWTEDFESDDEVDEVLYPEGNKFEDQFDIQLKGRVNK